MAQLFANNAASKLAAAITIGATSLTLTTGEGAKFPAITGSDFFLVTLVGGTASSETSWEIVSVTARAGDVLTVVRAQEGTAAAAWAIATPVELRATAGTLAVLTAASGVSTVNGVAGAVTLKTVNGSSIVGSGNLALGAAPIYKNVDFNASAGIIFEVAGHVLAQTDIDANRLRVIQ